MCQNGWADETDTHDEYDEYKTLELGTSRSQYSVIKKYTQAPVEYQHFKNEQLNQLTIDMALNSFVKMAWSFMGANHPKATTESPIADLSHADFGTALTTKSFKTLEGYMYIGDSEDDMVQNRQCSNFQLTINNNMENTSALFETEAIEQSLGDFTVTGSMDVWKSGDFARQLKNDAIDGKEKYLKVAVTRNVGTKQYAYEIHLIVHLDESSESKDGNKLKDTIKFTVGRADGLKFIKTVKTL